MDPQKSKHPTSNSNKPQEPTVAVKPTLSSETHVFSSLAKDEGNQPTVQLSSIVEIPNNRIRKGSSNSIASSLAKGTTLLCFRMSDVAVSILVLLPLTIGMWRGIWQLMSAYVYHPSVSIAIGNTILTAIYFFQEPLKEIINPQHMSFVLFYFVSRTFLVIYVSASIVQWQGLWELLDNETGPGTESAIISLLTGVGILIFSKVFCNVLATPLFVGVDEATSLVEFPLRFKTPATSKWRYFLDCVWSVVIVQNLVVAAWRGLWNLANVHLYPADRLISAYLSLAMGTGICIVLSILQPCYFRFMIKQRGIMRLALFNLITTWGFIGCVLAWRGTWELYDLLLVFDTPLASEWLTTIIGTVGSVMLGCLSTVSSRGITVDGEDSGDGTVEWPISYISLLQQKRHHGIPFPEPWLFRYLCTSQRMLMTEPLTLRRTSTVGPTTGGHSLQETKSGKIDDEDACPIKLITNSIYIDHFDGPKSLASSSSIREKGQKNKDNQDKIS